MRLRLDRERLPEGADKDQVLDAVKRAADLLNLDTALRVVGLSPSRYHSWRQTQRLRQLDDRSSCPKTTPLQLTVAEASTIQEMISRTMSPSSRPVAPHALVAPLPSASLALRLRSRKCTASGIIKRVLAQAHVLG